MFFGRWLKNWGAGTGRVRRARDGEAEAWPAARPRGFAEAQARPFADQAGEAFGRAPRDVALDTVAFRTRAPDAVAGDAAEGLAHGSAVFASTGPQGHRQRMREKLLQRGADALADYELLEMLLFLAFKQGDTKPLAKALINRYGSFANVIAAPAEELLRLGGVGPHAATAIKLVQASALRSARAELMERPVLNSPEKLEAYLIAALGRERTEHFRVLFLDTRNRLIADEAQGKGTVNHTPVYPREVVKRVLELHATALILVHNHPSGDPKPSRDDFDMTREIQQAAGLLGVVVHDHVIVGNGRCFSFRGEGLMDG